MQQYCARFKYWYCEHCQPIARFKLANFLHGLSSLFALAIMLVYLYFGIVITVRRLHDLDRSGWWMLLFFVPLINLFVWIYILLFPGTRGSNQYGPIRTSPVWEKIVAWLVIILPYSACWRRLRYSLIWVKVSLQESQVKWSKNDWVLLRQLCLFCINILCINFAVVNFCWSWGKISQI